MAHFVTPSILSADFANLQQVCEMINMSKADGLHLDVMDGVFVPNISFGFPIIEAVHKHAKKPIDVHLMIVNADAYLKRFKDVGANILTVHAEACPHLQRTVDAIKKLDMEACVAINPQTPVISLMDIISYVDQVCIMSVNPGFGGQTFIENTFDKIECLNEIIHKKKAGVKIKIDGGIDLRNYAKLLGAGVDILVAGSSVFGAKDPLMTIDLLKG